MKRWASILILLSGMNGLNAQFGTGFLPSSQYLFNGLVLNPAYSGSRECLSINLLYRRHWVGMNGSPEIFSFGAHTPMKNNRVALGILVDHEQESVNRYSNAYFNYAYRFNVGKGKLALGLKGGVNHYDRQLIQIRLRDPGDDAFSRDENLILPNFGAGIYYYAERFFAGFSVPLLLSLDDKREIIPDYERYHYLFTTGALLRFSDNFKFKPSVLLDYTIDQPDTPLKYHLNGNIILFDDVLWLGGSYKSSQEVVGILEIQIGKQFRLGYSYDYAIGALNGFHHGSHEILLRYEFNFRVDAVNPRYF